MKKKLIVMFMAVILCLCPLMLAGCGEQFIIEQEYQLLGMQVVVDNTSENGFESGYFTDYFYGDIYISECKVKVGKEQTTLIWKHDDLTASFYFDVKSDDDEYPTYKYSSYTAYKNTTPINLLSNEDKELVGNYIEDIVEFNQIMKMGESSMQLITQKQSFTCYFMMIDRSTSTMVFMGHLFGFNI